MRSIWNFYHFLPCFLIGLFFSFFSGILAWIMRQCICAYKFLYRDSWVRSTETSNRVLLVSCHITPKFSSQFVNNLLSYPADRQTNKGKHITSLAHWTTSCAACSGAATLCPAPDLWPFNIESGVRVTCGVAYLCANFSLPRPLCFRLRPYVRDRRQTERCQTRIVA